MNHGVVRATVNHYGSSTRLSGDEGIINPLPGQYANYGIAEYSENGTMVWSGWWNVSYIDYLEPNLINTTHTILMPSQSGVFWMTINTTNRWVVGGNHMWKHSWYAFWIETDVTEGSVVRIWTANATVMTSDKVMFCGEFVDCWVANWTDPYGTTNTFFFDKKTGLVIGAHVFGDTYWATVTLVATNVPIGAYSPKHELTVSLEAPMTIQLGESSLLNATVYNYGLSNETDVEFQLLINGHVINSTVVPFLESRSFTRFTYGWTPPNEGIYNVTAYVQPAPGETSLENNQMTRFVRVSAPPEVGVKAGDWIRYNYTVTGAPPGTTLPQWMKVEFLSVEGTTATVRVTMHMSDGSEQNQTMAFDAVAGGEGIVIPVNLTTGDSIYISGYGEVTIEGETVRTYAGAKRTAIYTSFTLYEIYCTFYWDKETGVLVELSQISGGMNVTIRATETNMWEAPPFVEEGIGRGWMRIGFHEFVFVTYIYKMGDGQIELVFKYRGNEYSATWNIISQREYPSTETEILLCHNSDHGYLIAYKQKGYIHVVTYVEIASMSKRTTLSYEKTFCRRSEYM